MGQGVKIFWEVWPVTVFLYFSIQFVTLQLQENNGGKKGCLLHDRLFLELGAFISSQRVLLFTVQLQTTHQHSSFESRVRLEVKTLKTCKVITAVSHATGFDF